MTTTRTPDAVTAPAAAAPAPDRFVYTSTVRAIVRCTKKGCKRAHRATFQTTSTHRNWDGGVAVDRTVTRNGRESSYKDRYDLARIVARDFVCTGCGGHGYTFQVVQGSFSEAVKCGAKCRSAIGPRCECQCRGERHGEAHSAI